MPKRSHGLSNSPEYVSWACMHTRCRNKNVKHFERYGGRGISVCARWRSFENFLADMGQRPAPSMSVERVDPDGNYEPGNCRWATRLEQSRNTNRAKRQVFEGKLTPIAEIAASIGLSYWTARDRFDKGKSVVTGKVEE